MIKYVGNTKNYQQMDSDETTETYGRPHLHQHRSPKLLLPSIELTLVKNNPVHPHTFIWVLFKSKRI